MADNKEKSRADELFEMLNDFRDDEPKKVAKNGGDAELDSHIDEIIEILSKGGSPNEPEATERPLYGDGEIPVSIFDHLSDEGKDETAPTPAPTIELTPIPEPKKDGDSNASTVLSSHFSSADDYNIAPLPAEEEDEAEEEEESKLDRVGNILSKISFLPKALIYILLIFIISAYLSYYVITIGNDVFALVTDSREVKITLEEGATDESVAALLKNEGIIEYDWVYKLYMKYRGNDDGKPTEYIAGEHTLNFDFNYSQIITSLTSRVANREIKRVTIPEGFTVDQIIDLLIENGIGEREKYIEAITVTSMNIRTRGTDVTNAVTLSTSVDMIEPRLPLTAEVICSRSSSAPSLSPRNPPIGSMIF
jgi:hypothetical protein